MSSDIYSKPDSSKTVRHNRHMQEDRAGWEEREVDIYETAADDVVNNHTDFQSQEEGQHHALQKRPFRVPASCRGVLHTVILVMVITVSIYSLLVTLEVNRLNSSYNQLLNNVSDITLDKEQLETEKEKLEASYSQLQDKYNQLNNTYNQIKVELHVKCLGGWERFGSSYYKKFTEKKSWSESRSDCLKRGADLVIINSKEEHEFVRRLSGNGGSWIGLKAESSTLNSGWKWLDGSPLTTPFWGAGWPQRDSNTHVCAAVCCNHEGKWTSSLYTNKKNWICQK